MFRESLKSIKTIQKYLKSFVIRVNVESNLKNIKTIQNYIRMRRLRSKYNNLKQNVVKIQRKWRNYYRFKQQSIITTKNYFE